MEARLEALPVFRGWTKLILGLFFTAVGVLLTLDNFDYLDAEDYLRFWPAVMIVIGLVKLVEPGGRRVVGIVLAAIGAGLMLDTLDIVEFSIFQLWPGFLIAIGIALVLRSAGGIPDDKLPNVAFFESRRVLETSQNFRGGNYTAVLGGYELDLTGADITQSPAVMDVFAFWGGIEIAVPDGWEVIGEVMPVMGGFDVKTARVTSSRQLIIRGNAFMGGIEVKSASRRTS